MPLSTVPVRRRSRAGIPLAMRGGKTRKNASEVHGRCTTPKYMGLRQANFLARQDSDGEYYEKAEGII